MNIIQPKAEYWKQENPTDHIARCARVCYASEKTTDNAALEDRLWRNGHISVFRHVSRYYVINASTIYRREMFHILHSPYCAYVRHINKYYVSTNSQFVMDHSDFFEHFREIDIDSLMKSVRRFPPIFEIIRFTVCLTTQISTSRELNRTSPNNICEQSTRYVNFERKNGGITICRPWFMQALSPHRKFLFKSYCKFSEIAYKYFLKIGKPETAREILPLCTATRVVYTYSYKEWQHIFDLRYEGISGKPHPNAAEAAKLIQDEILNNNTEAVKMYADYFSRSYISSLIDKNNIYSIINASLNSGMLTYDRSKVPLTSPCPNFILSNEAKEKLIKNYPGIFPASNL